MEQGPFILRGADSTTQNNVPLIHKVKIKKGLAVRVPLPIVCFLLFFFLLLIKMSLYSFPEEDHRVHLKTICAINKSKGFRLCSYHFLHTFLELIHPCSSRRRQSAGVVTRQSWPFRSRAARDDWGTRCHTVPSGLHGIMSPNWVLVKSRLFSRLNREASTHWSHSLTRACFWKINFAAMTHSLNRGLHFGEWGGRGVRQHTRCRNAIWG